MTVRLVTRNEEATTAVGAALAACVAPGDVVLLTGDLGAGKTALTKGLASGLDVEEPITSPTFNILLVHPGRMPLFHIDLYRLEHADQLEDIDYWGTLESGGVSVVEWGDRFPESRPPEYLEILISITGDTDRSLEVIGVGERGKALAAALSGAVRARDGVERA